MIHGRIVPAMRLALTQGLFSIISMYLAAMAWHGPLPQTIYSACETTQPMGPNSHAIADSIKRRKTPHAEYLALGGDDRLLGSN